MNALMNLERTLANMLARDAERRAQRRALDVAVHRFAKLHPTWHEALFDEPFVRRVLAGNPGGVDAAELARSWTRQFRYRDERRRERDVRQLEPVADSFLRLLAQAQSEVDLKRDRHGSGAAPSGRPEPAPF